MRIMLLSSIAPEAMAQLEVEHDVVTAFDGGDVDLGGLIGDREVAILRSGVQLTAELIEAAPELRLILRAGSGIDNIDLDAARSRDIRVFRLPGPSAQAVAELTFALILAVARKVAFADRSIRAGHWPKRKLGGNLLRGKTLGILGAGSIGGRVGDLGAAWQMRVLGCVAGDANDRAEAYSRRGITLTDLDQVVAEADILSVHTPLDASTRHLVDRDLLARMKPGAYLVNMARGGVVDEAALGAALASGHLAGAALDVHEREGEGVVPALADRPDVVLTPHIGGMALESQSEIGASVVAILRAAAASQPIPDLDGVVPVT